MSVRSYVAQSVAGKKAELIEALTSLQGCEVIPSVNTDVVVVITDTVDGDDEKRLRSEINAIGSLQMFSMVSGFDNSDK